MALVDYEAAYLELAEVIQSREGWGSKALAAEMQRLAVKHRVSETFLERALRLYGGQVTLAVDPAGSHPSGAGGTPPTGAADVARLTEVPEEERDERRTTPGRAGGRRQPVAS